MSMRARFSAAIAGVVLISVLGVVSPLNTSAAGRPFVWTSSADMFWCTSSQTLCTSTTVTTIPRNTPLKMVCWRDDRNVWGGSGTSRWFYALLDNGQEGFVWSDQIASQTPNTPSCNGINWIQVSDFAIGHMGQTHASSSESASFSAAGWRPGPVGEWQGDCIKFAYLAWGKQTLIGNAIAVYRSYRDRGMVHPGRPPRGAMVFWNRTNLGHVAISIGNWQAVGTQGLDNQVPIKAIDRYAVNTSDYLGWVMPVTPAVPQNPS